MTFELTPERLQEIAVGCVTQFIQKTASLNEAISKEAQALELNADQTKRVIEASNTIAYLRQLEKSADRTFEFEVADYGKVMAHMCMPEDMLKAAGTPPWLDKDKDNKEDGKEDDKGEEKDKKDEDDSKEKKFQGEDFGRRSDKEEKSEKSDDKEEKKESKEDDKEEKSEKSDEDCECDDSEESRQEKRAMLMNAYFQGKATLEKMAYDEAILYMDLTKAASVVGKDPDGLEKLAFVVEASELDKVTKLCGIEKRAQQDLVFTDNELKAVKELQGIYKKAQDFVKEKAELTNFVKRAETVLFKSPVDLEKQAFIGGMVAKGVGKAVHGLAATVTWAGKKIVNGTVINPVKNAYKFNRAAKAQKITTDQAIETYDKIKRAQGSSAAQKHFGGSKPGVMRRVGVGGVLTATTGLSIDHANNVKDL